MAAVCGWCSAGLVYIEGCGPHFSFAGGVSGATESGNLSMESNADPGSLDSLSKLERGEATSTSVESGVGTSREFEKITGKSQSQSSDPG